MKSERFPETLIEAIRYFSDEAVCRDFLASLRWPHGVACMRCGSTELGFVSTRSLWR
ncbi:MAG: transposase, partial [Candidatus Dormibacteraceae bacterium]